MQAVTYPEDTITGCPIHRTFPMFGRLTFAPHLEEHVYKPSIVHVIRYIMRSSDGNITAREAMADLDMTSATLASRMSELDRLGFTVYRRREKNPHTGKRYTKYYVRD